LSISLPAVDGISLELNDDEFTNQEVVMYTVRGEPHQNVTVLFGDNRFNMYYDAEKITLNDTGVFIGYYGLTDDRNYDVTHWISVQNRSSSATVTYILRYSDAQRFKHDAALMGAIWQAVGVVLFVIVAVVLIVAFREREKRLKAEDKMTTQEKFHVFRGRLHLDRMMDVFDKNAPSNPMARASYQMKWIKHFVAAIKRQVTKRSDEIAEALRWMQKYPALKKEVLECLRRDKILPIDAKMDEAKLEAFLRPFERADLNPH
jgi:hypothetical protein